MYKLIGKEICTGNYMGKDWSHLKLYCIVQGDFKSDDTFQGEKVETIKIKNEVSRFYNDLEIGCTFKPYYDRFGNVEEISIQVG